MQVRAIVTAAADAHERNIQAKPEIMIPLVINVREVRLIAGDVLLMQGSTEAVAQFATEFGCLPLATPSAVT